MAKVFLSAGHGGNDSGACAYGMKEEDINLQVMLTCESELKRHGVIVVCSRRKDENDPVSQEVTEANESGADLAVSFHTNAARGDGSETFYYTTNKSGKKLAELCEKHTKAIGQNSRGIKSGNHLYFVKRTNMTAVLCEIGFIDNDTDNDIFDTVAERRKFGVAYAKAILEYLGISYKAASTSSGASTSKPATGSFLVKVKCDLNIRVGAGAEYTKVGCIKDKGTYTIVKTEKAKDGGTWGKLKSGAGWINISSNYVTRL